MCGLWYARGMDIRDILIADVERQIPSYEQAIEGFWDRIDIRTADECWPWREPTTKAGYVQISVGSRLWLGHRFFWLFVLEREIPADTPVIDHSCHNDTGCIIEPCPHKSCFNPDHLEAVTHQENMHRGNMYKPKCTSGHLFTPENTLLINRSDGYTERRCRICSNERQNALTASKLPSPCEYCGSPKPKASGVHLCDACKDRKESMPRSAWRELRRAATTP